MVVQRVLPGGPPATTDEWRLVLPLLRRRHEATADGPRCAVHGDVIGGNVLAQNGVAALIDWDEARVDVPVVDFAHLPLAADDAVRRAGVAWAAVTC